MNDAFLRLVSDLPAIGLDWHGTQLLENARRNRSAITQALRDLPPCPETDVLVVSAGPSLTTHVLERVREARDGFALVAIDGSLCACLRAGIVPDYTLTLDPHPTRIVRWFGDPDFEANSTGDDYFARQDLDESFRADAAARNAQNIALVDFYAPVLRLVIGNSAPQNVVQRTSRMQRFWFAPLVDNPHAPDSLTRQLSTEGDLPALNSGGTVGTAAIVFARTVLKARRIAVIGMDLGYAKGLPLERTQSWNMLKDRPNVAEMYPAVTHPLWGECFTDPTYWWYRQNLLRLLESGGFGITNCSGAGTLYGRGVQCMGLKEWASGS